MAMFALLLGASLPIAPVYAVNGSDLVALYHFDGNAEDSSMYENDGTLVGDAGFMKGYDWIGSYDGEWLTLDGDGDYVQVPDSESLDITGPFTV
jgi:hypothetical protein